MHYYPFHVGDYQTHTAHLSDTEDLAYRRMLDLYYINQKPLPSDAAKVARLIRMPAAVEEVRGLLEEFFVLQDGSYTNKRCDKEIASFIKQKLGGVKGAKVRWDKAKQKGGNGLPNREGNGVGIGEGNATPIATNNQNQEPRTNKDKGLASKPDEVSDQIWDDFLRVRKAHNAPLTKTAFARIVMESIQANMSLEDVLKLCTEKNWRSFEANWLKDKGPKPIDQFAGAL